MNDEDEWWMRQALDQARYAQDAGEVPVGAVLVLDSTLLGTGYNQPIGTADPSAHAEVAALRAAAAKLSNYRLPGSTLYVTLEPCVMCAGAILHARVSRLVFGAYDAKAGAVTSVYSVIARPRHNQAPLWTGGVLENDCAGMLRDFFRLRRLSRGKDRSYGEG